MSTWDLFLKNYNQASPELRAFIDSDEISKIAHSYVSSRSQQTFSPRELVSQLADYVLGVISAEDLASQLKLNGDEITTLITGLETKKKNFTEGNKNNEIKAIPEANLETKERLELRPQVSSGGGASSATSGVPHAGATPLTREELMNALGGKRTMAQDIEAARMKREGGTSSIPPPPPPRPQ